MMASFARWLTVFSFALIAVVAVQGDKDCAGKCKNNGVCIYETDWHFHYCQCEIGFTGMYCDRKETPMQAVCNLQQSSSIEGTITFSEYSTKTKITGTIQGLPEGKHGFHIHEFGNLENGCSSFGGHYNPFGLKHGGPTDGMRHAGDLGNIEADGNGQAKVQIVDDQVKLYGEYSVVGRGIVVHAGEDDLGRGGDAGSAATGNAGARLACCVIKSLNDGSAVEYY